MGKTAILPDGVYEKGKVSVDTDIPIDGETFALSLARTTWPDTGKDVLAVKLLLTLDGATWMELGGFTVGGGIALGKDGLPRAEQMISVGPIPEPKNTLRRMRLELDALSPIRTKADAESKTAEAVATVK